MKNIAGVVSLLMGGFGLGIGWTVEYNMPPFYWLGAGFFVVLGLFLIFFADEETLE